MPYLGKVIETISITRKKRSQNFSRISLRYLVQ